MNIDEVSNCILDRVSFQVPLLVKSSEKDPQKTSNPITIMQEISKSAYLEEIMFGKKGSKERSEIESYIELAQRLTVEELTSHVNKHLAMRMFLVG